MKTFFLALAVAVALLAGPTTHAQQPAADAAAPSATPAPRQTAAQRRASAARARTAQSLRNQSTSANRTFTNQRTTTRTVTPTTAPGRVDGSVVRAIRSGQPLQQINPFAPAEYGNGGDVTRRDPEDPFGRSQGLKLFTVEF